MTRHLKSRFVKASLESLQGKPVKLEGPYDKRVLSYGPSCLIIAFYKDVRFPLVRPVC